MLEVLEARDCPSAGLLDPTFGSGGIVNLPSTTDLAARRRRPTGREGCHRWRFHNAQWE